jgi:hypothetical protein
MVIGQLPGQSAPLRHHRQMAVTLCRRCVLIARPRCGSQDGHGAIRQPCTRAKFRTDSIRPRTPVAVSGFTFQIGSRIWIRCAVVMSFAGKLPMIGAAYVASVFRTCCPCLEVRQAGSLPAINRSAASANVVRRTGSADCAASSACRRSDGSMPCANNFRASDARSRAPESVTYSRLPRDILRAFPRCENRPASAAVRA